MDLISVIVPVYNVEKYLDTCVESIINQTYSNLEIILVDDGSTDGCPALCDEWAKRDNRIKVIHKANEGQGVARNCGAEIAAGSYIGYVDSDDVIAPDMYEKLYEQITENDVDMVQCGMLSFSDFPLKVFPESTEPIIIIYTPCEAVKSLIRGENITSTCPNVLIKKEIADRISFDSGMINEDVMWIYRALRESKNIAVTNERLYGYYQRPGSTMNAAYSVKRFDALRALRMRAESIKNDFPVLFPIAERAYANSCMYNFQTLCRFEKTEEYNGFKKRLYRMFCDSDLKIVFSVSELKYKLWYSMFKAMPALTCKIRNLLKIGL